MPKKSSNKTTTNTIAEPWKASQPLLKDLIGATGTAFGSGQFDISPYGGERIAPQSGMTQQSLGMFGDIAGAGNPFGGPAAEGFGDFMNADPYRDLDLLKQNALGDIMPAAMSRFSGAGMLDSTLAADAAGRAATEAIASYEYGAWGDMQSRKLAALDMAPDLARASYTDPMMLAMAGGTQTPSHSRRSTRKWRSTTRAPISRMTNCSARLHWPSASAAWDRQARQPCSSRAGG